MLVIGLFIITGSISTMIAIARRSPFAAYTATITGAVGIFFFANLSFLAVPGLGLSVLAVILGGLSVSTRRRDKVRRTMVLSQSGVWRLPAQVSLSDSGQWRLL